MFPLEPTKPACQVMRRELLGRERRQFPDLELLHISQQLVLARWLSGRAESKGNRQAAMAEPTASRLPLGLGAVDQPRRKRDVNVTRLGPVCPQGWAGAINRADVSGCQAARLLLPTGLPALHGIFKMT